MSLFKNLLETYEKCKDATGIVHESAGSEVDERKTFLPIFHTTFKSQISIILDNNGDFVDAECDKKETTIIIPCTDSSAGRSSGIAAHPLCDQLDYVGNINEKKTCAYLNELGKWKESSIGISREKLQAVYNYVSSGTIIADLEKKRIFKESEYDICDDFQTPNNEKIRKIGVRFVVEILDDKISNVWEDTILRQSWIDYVKPINNNDSELFDYLSGNQIGKIAGQHPKNINSMTGNAKLLSCNTEYGFRFVGRFTNQDDAVVVDYEQSQKMHQTLRWLINNHGYNIDMQTIIVWAVDSNTNPLFEPYRNSYDLFGAMQSIKTDSKILLDAKLAVDADYSKKMRNLFQGLGNVDKAKEHAKTICIAVFDAATTGRMALTFYQEFPEDQYLENIIKWHEETSYHLTAWVASKSEKPNEKRVPVFYIGAPSYDDILFAVYGKARGGNDAGYNTLKKKIRKQLLECMFGNFSFPKSMVSMAIIRASNPMSFENENDWKRSVSISCALARKYYKQNEKEDIGLALDETRKEREYLYGRLLAIADRLEQTAMYKANKSDTRTTNAIRFMSAFSVKPYHTWGILYQQLLPYINQLGGAGYYQSLIDDIMVMLADEYEDNSPLSPLYLLGFSAQRRAFIKEKNNQEMEDYDNDATE